MEHFPLLILICLLVTLPIKTSAKKGFLVTLPRHLRANSDAEACFTFQEYTGIDLKVSIKFYSKEWHKEEREEIAERRETFHDGVGRCIPIAVPSRPEHRQVIVGVEIVETERVWDPESGAYVTRRAKAETEVKIRDKSQLTFIQTDKPIYKPGQTVQLRILTINDEFLPVEEKIPSLWVEDAQGSRVSQWSDVQPSSGLVSLSFPLSTEPNLGVWKVKAQIGDGQEVKDFKVIEYVLPKFEVQIKPPSYVLVDQPEIKLKVCATYSYGQPVRGQLGVKVGVNRWGGLQEGRPTYNKRFPDFYNCESFSVSSSELQLNSADFSIWSAKLYVEATVIEEGTGIALNSTDESVGISTDAFKLSIETSAPQFKPFMGFSGFVSAKMPDETPVAGKEILVKIDLKDKLIQRNVTTDASGRAPFTIPHEALDDTLKSFSLVAQEPNRVPPKYVWPQPPNSKIDIKSPSESITVEKWFSPSGSFMKIVPSFEPGQALNCKDTANFHIFYTTTAKKVHTFYYQVLSRGRIVKSGIKQHFFRPSPLNPSNFEDDRTLNIFPKPTTTTTTTTTATTTAGANATLEPKLEIIEIEPKPYVWVDPTSPPIPYLEPSSFPLELAIEARMSPGIKLVVYYIREDGEIVADSIKLKINSCFNNQVKLSYREKKDNRVEVERKRPGEDLKIRLEASSGSLCALGIVDKSVYFLGGENQLNKEKVFAGLAQIDNFDRYEYDYPAEDEYCQKILEEKREERKKKAEKELGKKNNTSSETSERKKRSSWWPRGSSEGIVDALQAFKDTSLAVLTDLTLQTRPCFESRYDMRFYAAEVDAHPQALPKTGRSGNEGRSPTVSLRSYFPETWLWHLHQVGSSGVTEVPATLPHAITEWVGSAFCTSPTNGIGIAQDASVTAFQPFFVSYAMPYSAIRGEKLPLKVTVFNYLTKCLTVRLLLKTSSGFKLADNKDRERHLCVCGGRSKTEVFKIVPSVIGTVNVTVRAESVKSRPELCIDAEEKKKKNKKNNNNNEVNPEMADASYEGIRDAIVKPLLVEAEGIPQEYSLNDLICPESVTPKVGNTPIWERQLHLDIPPATQGYIADSARGEVVVIGDVMGSAMSNIDSLLKMPYGCGEQNMVHFVPNIFIMRYLEATGRQDPKIKDKAIRYMRTGYQQELTYQHPDGSYSAFGPSKHVWDWIGVDEPVIVPEEEPLLYEYEEDETEGIVMEVSPPVEEEISPPFPFDMISPIIIPETPNNDTGSDSGRLPTLPPVIIPPPPPPKDEGSLWLTAFVVKSFAQAQSYIFVSGEEIEKSVKFLRDHQNKDGSFPVVGKLFSKSLKGGLAGSKDESNIGLTAYALISLLEANLTRNDPMILSGFDFLRKVSPQSVDTYTCAVVTFGFHLLDPKSREAGKWIADLETRAKTQDGDRYWTSKEETKTTSSSSSSSSSRWSPPWEKSTAANVETTAYALLSLISSANSKDDSVATLIPIVKWLTKQRNQFGGYYSTQDTVVGIQALAEYASAMFGGVVDLQVRFRQDEDGPDKVVKFDIDANNALVLNTVPLTSLPTTLQVQGKGSGCAVLQTNIRYNIEGVSPAEPKFQLKYRFLAAKETIKKPHTPPTPPPTPNEPAFQTNSTDELNSTSPNPFPEFVCEKAALELCASYLGADGASNMALLEVKMVTGWAPVKKSLEKARKRRQISKYEVDGNRVQIYFDRLTVLDSCVTVEMEMDMKVEDVKPATLRLYDYYEPSEVVTESYAIRCRYNWRTYWID